MAEDDKEDPFVQGMDKIYKQLMTTLDGIGETDRSSWSGICSDFHNAVMHGENEKPVNYDAAKEFQKGYMYRDS